MKRVARIIEGLKRKGKRIVHCHGVFDLLHPGHIKHLEAAKKKGDVLVVTITKDEHVNKGPGRPVFNHFLRAESVSAIECVDFVAINEWATAVETIKKLRPDFYVKGSDYVKREEDVTRKIFDEERAVKSVGGSIYFTDQVLFSSSALINTYFAPYPQEAKEFLLKFRKHYTPNNIISALQQIRNIKILVIGDIIIDEYHYCVGIGKSQKDNIIATKYLNEETFSGGVLAAANHLGGFCNNVTLVSCIGTRNNYKQFIKNHLKKNVWTKFYYSKGALTAVKRRFIDPGFLNKLFEVCFLEDANYLPVDLENKICNYLNSCLHKFDMVLVADFGHGLITPNIVKVITKKAKFLAVNTQTNSANLGFNLITKFPRADYICIDEPEIRFACHDRFTDLKELVLKISKELHCDKIIITRGKWGSLAYTKKEGFTAIPVFSKEVIDTVGAGDAFLSVTSPCVFKGSPMDMVGFIGNAAGALKVLIVGNRSSVEPVPLYKYITALLK
jgi:rfaE bifunctional protein nucleotidyltransferase chain/domain